MANQARKVAVSGRAFQHSRQPWQQAGHELRDGPPNPAHTLYALTQGTRRHSLGFLVGAPMAAALGQLSLAPVLLALAGALHARAADHDRHGLEHPV